MPLISLFFARISTHRWSVAVAIFSLLFVVILLPQITGQNGLWVRIDQPLFSANSSSGLIGYSQVINGVPLQKENLPTLKGIALLSGGTVDADFYQKRVLYNFIASLFVPFFGLFPSLLFLNIACWVTATWLSWRLAFKLSDGNDIAASLSAALTVTGLGWLVHMSDNSAHLLADVTYFAGMVILLESDIYRRRRRSIVHLALGICLAFTSLTYNTGIMLAGVYVLLAIRHNRGWPLLAALAIGLVAQPLWGVILDRLATSPAAIVEEAYLAHSVARWTGLISSDPGAACLYLGKFLLEYMSIDMPAILPLGGLAVLTSPSLSHYRWPMAVGMVVPFFAILVFRFSTVGTIAYSIYGVVPLYHAAIATSLACRSQRTVLVVGPLLFLAQLFWSTGFLWGWAAPLMAYFYGGVDIGGLWWHLPSITSLTGNEPTPGLFWGHRSLDAAGLVWQPRNFLFTGFNPFLSLLAKSLPTGLGLWLIYLLLSPGAVRTSAMVGLCSLVIISSLMVGNNKALPPPMSVDLWSTVRYPGQEPLSYRLSLAPAWCDRLAVLPESTELDLLIGVSVGDFNQNVLLGDAPIPVVRKRDISGWGALIQLDKSAFATALQRSTSLTLILEPKTPLTIRGWQKPGLPGRTLSPEGTVLPMIELRILDQDGTLRDAGF